MKLHPHLLKTLYRQERTYLNAVEGIGNIFRKVESPFRTLGPIRENSQSRYIEEEANKMEYTIIIKPSEKYHDFNDKCWTTIIGRTLYIVRNLEITELSLKHYEIEQIHENFVNGYTTSLLLRDAMNALKPDSLLESTKQKTLSSLILRMSIGDRTSRRYFRLTRI
ncbi:hypothetical protein V1477_016428 [Vespula maculifrons]|uniref:Uncharacterized protein n=1 Tax=Vespula maculifrons TaxID=7453 RepID=A0ABD2BCZ8_VESMC